MTPDLSGSPQDFLQSNFLGSVAQCQAAPRMWSAWDDARLKRKSARLPTVKFSWVGSSMVEQEPFKLLVRGSSPRRPKLPDGVMVAQVILVHFVMVRIHIGQF